MVDSATVGTIVRYVLFAASPPYDVITFAAMAFFYSDVVSYFHKNRSGEVPAKVYVLSPSFQRYFLVSATIGLLFPVIFLTAAPFIGGAHKWWGVETQFPHLFLLICQVLEEKKSSSKHRSIPASLLVPLLYNARRMFALYASVLRSQSYISGAEIDGSITGRVEYLWMLFGWLLAVSNLLFWAYNLFCFLIPVYIPDALRVHFAQNPNWPRVLDQPPMQPHVIALLGSIGSKKEE